MKTITIDDKKIEISDESYEAFKKQFVTKDKAILWKPEIEQAYWYADIDGDGKETEWAGDLYDEFRFSMGGIYRTEKEEDEAFKTGWIAKRKAEVEILRFIAENDLEWEWEFGKGNYSIYYNFGEGLFDNAPSSNLMETTLTYFKSESDAQKVIDAMTPQLKILFGVKG